MTSPPRPPGSAGGRRATDGAPPQPAADGPTAGTRLSAAEIHDNVRVAAEEEMRRPAAELLWSALAAGLRRTWRTLRRVLRLWVIVLLGNLAGALAFAVVAARTGLLRAPLRAALLPLAVEATSGGFWMVAFRAIFAGWLVALMAWLVSSTRATGAQLVLIALTTAPIAAFGFAHSIAGSVEAFYRAAAGEAGWGAMVGSFIVPAVLGNILGGVTLVALLNYGQVAGATPGRRH